MGRLTTIKPRVQMAESRQLAVINPDSWRQGKTTAERGYGYRWQKARETHLRHNPLCVFCQDRGRVEVATVVDHIKDHRGDQGLFWDTSNWQSLCKHCHDSVKRLQDRRMQIPAYTMGPATVINIVIGPTCGGKSTFVQSHKADGDVVVDYDKLAQALGATTSHKAAGLIKDAAFAARDAVIDMLLSSHGGTAWIIHTRPQGKALEKYRLAGAVFHTVNPGLDECIARASRDGRPDGTAMNIREWFKESIEIDARGYGPADKQKAVDFLLFDESDSQ